MTRTAWVTDDEFRKSSGVRSAISLKALVGCLALAVYACTAASPPVRAQNVQFTQGAVGSGLDNTIQIPIASYAGRGAASLPVTLYYSSRVWKVSYVKTVHDGASLPQSVAEAVYAEHSASGWTTSLDVPKVEWPKLNDRYLYNGKPYHAYLPGSTYRVPNVFIHMPDGSTHELRRGDDIYADNNVVSTVGTFYALDGSRLRYDSTGAATGTLYMPDGSRYVLNGADAQFLDRNGNALNYDGTTRQWTDALGATIGNTTLRGAVAMPWPANPQAGQDYAYTPPGFAAPYIFKWRSLSAALTPDAQGNTPQLKAASSHYLPLANQDPTDRGGTNFPQPSGLQSLFLSDVGDDTAADPQSTFTYVVGRGQGAGDLFNPVVLSEVVLPNGLSYRFTYNVYGEIDKVVYPTGGYEQCQYDTVPALGNIRPPYTEASRGVKSRRVSPNGTGGSDEAVWTYAAALTELHTYRVRVTAPDQSVTESYRHNPYSVSGKTFGYQDALTGLAFDERVYDRDPDNGGVMLRRTLTEWAQTQPVQVGPTPNLSGNIQPTSYTAYRNPRPARSVSLILDTGGAALAKRVEYFYAAADPDTENHGNSQAIETTTGLDRTGVTESHFAEGIDRDVAKTAAIGTIWDGYVFPPATSSETAYVTDQGYRARNILGLVASVTLKDAAGQPVSKTETFYDEAERAVLPPYGDLDSDPNYVDPATPLRANPTTVRRYTDLSAGSYLETRAQFDQYGNPVNFWDERGVQSQKEYSAAYRHAYLTKTTGAVPDPSGEHGSASAFTSSSTYEAPTGLVLTTTDANGQLTTFSYDIDATHRDPLNRLRKVTRPDGGWTKSSYNDVVGNLYVHVETKFDATTSTHAYQFYDKMGRASRSFALESGQTYVVVEASYDKMGRASQTSNPFRATVAGTGDPAQAGYWATTAAPQFWTTNTYDALGRVRQVTLPDSTSVTTEYVGVYTTVTDQAGRKRRQKTDALGRVVRVDEPDGSGNLDDASGAPVQPSFYGYDALGNVVSISQGLTSAGLNPENPASYTQHRYFKYDALSRLTYEKQAEQAATIPDPVTGQPFWSRRLVYDETFGGVSYKGLLTTAEDARHVVTTFYYDRIGRPYQTTYSDGTPTLTSKYDQARADAPPAGEQPAAFFNKGRLTELTTAATAEAPQTQQLYDYDLMGRTGRQRQVVAANTYELRYGYNLGGGLVSERYPSGRVVSYSYDAAARLASVSSGATTYASAMTYKPFGALESMSLGNGTVYSISYSDARLQLTSIALRQGAATLQRYDYTYGAADAATGAVDASKNAGQVATVESRIGEQRQWQQRFSYDTLGRLSSAAEYSGDTLQNRSYLLSYGYDCYGNRYQHSSRNQNNPFAQSWVEDGSFDAATNRFTSGVTYDDAGNVTIDSRFGRLSFLYDANNRQRQSSNLDGSNAVGSVYDGAGRRVAVKAGGQITRVMVYDASGELVAEYGGVASANGTSYVMADAQGSTRVVMDGAGGVVSRRDYLPFGEDTSLGAGVGGRTAAQGYGGDEVRRGYAGMERDEATRMSHTLWREYDSLSGRWTAPDPYGGSMSLANPQSLNRYTYVNNDPVNLTDPAGLMLAAPQSHINSDTGVVQTDDESYALTLQGASDAGWEKEVNAQYAREHDVVVVKLQEEGGGSHYGTISSVTAAALDEAESYLEGRRYETSVNEIEDDSDRLCLSNAVEVVVWGRPHKGKKGWNPVFAFGHISYIIDGVAYSWEKHVDPQTGREDWLTLPAEKYIASKTKDGSIGIGYVIDFGSYEANEQFRNLLLSAYNKHSLTGKQLGYDILLNNCGDAFKRAINGMHVDGIPQERSVKPSSHQWFIEHYLVPRNIARVAATYR